MVSEVVQCLNSDWDDAGIENVNISGDMIAKKDRINKEIYSVPPWKQCRSNSFEVLKFWEQFLSVIHDQVVDSMEGNHI